MVRNFLEPIAREYEGYLEEERRRSLNSILWSTSASNYPQTEASTALASERQNLQPRDVLHTLITNINAILRVHNQESTLRESFCNQYRTIGVYLANIRRNLEQVEHQLARVQDPSPPLPEAPVIPFLNHLNSEISTISNYIRTPDNLLDPTIPAQTAKLDALLKARQAYRQYLRLL